MGHDQGAIAAVQQAALAEAMADKGNYGQGGGPVVPLTAVSAQTPPPQPPLLDRGPEGTADTSAEAAEGE